MEQAGFTLPPRLKLEEVSHAKQRVVQQSSSIKNKGEASRVANSSQACMTPLSVPLSSVLHSMYHSRVPSLTSLLLAEPERPVHDTSLVVLNVLKGEAC